MPLKVCEILKLSLISKFTNDYIYHKIYVFKWEKVCYIYMYLCRYDSAQVPAKLISKPYNCSRFKYSILFFTFKSID